MPEQSCCRRLCGCGVMIAIVAGAGYGLWYWLGGGSEGESFDLGDFTNVLGNLSTDLFDELWGEDPFVGNSVGDNSTSEWESRAGQGLSLEIQNSLDDTWTAIFEQAVSDWDNGDPDALTLTTRTISVDRACSSVDGVMKVCNANYGETGWLGLNELLLLDRGIIVSSVAKMNEYYLLNSNEAERQYTMCHEIGHGFGLPHTDEIFTNADLGDCLDYTDSPENNLNPGAVNYETLVTLYGQVQRRNLKSRSTAGGTTTLEERPAASSTLSQSERALYDEAMHTFEQQLATPNSHRRLEARGWRLLSTHSRGEHYERHLDNGYKLRVRVLRPLLA